LKPTTKNFLNGPPVNPGSVHVLCSVVDAQAATKRLAMTANSDKRVRAIISATPSAMLEFGFALFDESAHAFLLVVQPERSVEFASLEQQPFGERRLVRPVDRFLDFLDDGQRERRDLRGDCERFLLELVRGNDPC